MITHAMDCDLHNGPAMTPGPCSCGAEPGRKPDPTTSEWPAPDADEMAQILATLETVLIMARDRTLVSLPIEQAHLLHKKLTMLVAGQQEGTTMALIKPLKRAPWRCRVLDWHPYRFLERRLPPPGSLGDQRRWVWEFVYECAGCHLRNYQSAITHTRVQYVRNPDA